ncbi:MAG: DUF488 domain-containing protein [Bacteroidaceae bacterium]|nr:DUF488 domain-containing protein [Bacteroidaceae bacterium]
MQKYLFLYSRINRSDNRFYDFVPYKYGCFSFVANNDINVLAGQGYVSIDDSPDQERRYTLLHEMNFARELDMFDAAAVRKLCETYGSMSQDELIAETYRKYPFTAINSQIKEKLLNQEELASVNRQKSRMLNNEPALMTMGYEGLSVEKYMTTLIQSGIKVLCDVRKNAYSQKYGFCKKTLMAACEGLGIKYIHIPDLGIESDFRKDLDSQAAYDSLFEQYEKTVLVRNGQSLSVIRNLIKSEGRVCLLCFEKDPRQCHRTRIANALMAFPNADYKYIPMVI